MKRASGRPSRSACASASSASRSTSSSSRRCAWGKRMGVVVSIQTQAITETRRVVLPPKRGPSPHRRRHRRPRRHPLRRRFLGARSHPNPPPAAGHARSRRQRRCSQKPLARLPPRVRAVSSRTRRSRGRGPLGWPPARTAPISASSPSNLRARPSARTPATSAAPSARCAAARVAGGESKWEGCGELLPLFARRGRVPDAVPPPPPIPAPHLPPPPSLHPHLAPPRSSRRSSRTSTSPSSRRTRTLGTTLGAARRFERSRSARTP
jgi:hypothetical protein